MDDIPAFTKGFENAIASKLQSSGVEGCVYDGVDGKQMAYWICEKDGVSKEHFHEFDDYFKVVQETYILIIEERRIGLKKRDEYFIPKHIPHAGEFKTATRTIHCFSGKRAE